MDTRWICWLVCLFDRYFAAARIVILLLSAFIYKDVVRHVSQVFRKKERNTKVFGSLLSNANERTARPFNALVTEPLLFNTNERNIKSIHPSTRLNLECSKHKQPKRKVLSLLVSMTQSRNFTRISGTSVLFQPSSP